MRTRSPSSIASPAGSPASSRTLFASTGSTARPRAAIVRPVERYAELTGETVSVEPLLVERVLDEVGTGDRAALGGLGVVEGGEDGARIEAPYLQVVMQRLWEDERAAGSDILRVETLSGWGARSASSRSTSRAPWAS